MANERTDTRRSGRRGFESFIRTIDSVKVILSVECQCGARKNQRDALCRRCFRMLPAGLQTRIYLPIGSGFEQAYAEALEALKR